MMVAWLAILPVVLLTIGFACFLVFFVIRNNNKSHTFIDPKPQTDPLPKKKEESL